MRMFIKIAISNPIGKFHGSKNILEADDIDSKLSKNKHSSKQWLRLLSGISVLSL